MKGEIRASLCACAAAAVIMACASKEPVRSSSANASGQTETSAEYRQLADNANQQWVCKRQTVLGTRLPTVVCVTQAELNSQRERAEEVMRDLQASAPTRQPIPDRPPLPASQSPRQ